MITRKVTGPLVDGMKVRLIANGVPVWENLGPHGFGIVSSYEPDPRGFVRIGPVGPAYRDVTGYNSPNWYYEELIETIDYRADQVADEAEDLL